MRRLSFDDPRLPLFGLTLAAIASLFGLAIAATGRPTPAAPDSEMGQFFFGSALALNLTAWVFRAKSHPATPRVAFAAQVAALFAWSPIAAVLVAVFRLTRKQV